MPGTTESVAIQRLTSGWVMKLMMAVVVLALSWMWNSLVETREEVIASRNQIPEWLSRRMADMEQRIRELERGR